MKLLTTRAGAYRTGSDIADAVLRYDLALARKQDVDLVDVPFVNDDGDVHRVEFTVGWQRDTAAISDSAISVGGIASSDELLDVDTVVALYAKTELLGAAQGRPFSDTERRDLQWTNPDGEI